MELQNSRKDKTVKQKIESQELSSHIAMKSRAISFARISAWTKEWWADHRDDAISAAIVFLLVSGAFAVGVILGAKLFEDSQITINCPPNFWEKK